METILFEEKKEEPAKILPDIGLEWVAGSTDTPNLILLSKKSKLGTKL